MPTPKTAHDGAFYSDASIDYQEALIAIGQPSPRRAYGEAPRPAALDIALIHQRVTTALLLARPIKVARTKCAPCQWLFIAGNIAHNMKRAVWLSERAAFASRRNP